MSIYFSRYGLNTYRQTPYFQAHLPPDYPESAVLQKCRAFRRLPPNLKSLAALAKRWYERKVPPEQTEAWDIASYYDAAGNELDRETGRKLTDAEIDAQWLPNPSLDTFVVSDIQFGPFADPGTWEPEAAEDMDNRELPTNAQLLSDIASHGRKATAEEYGIPEDQLPTT